MDSIGDFEDMLRLLAKHRARYVIVGGLAFIYHAKPRFTKDMDLWVDPTPANLRKVNRALAEFGSPVLLEPEKDELMLQIGVAPNRIDLLKDVGGVRFSTAWRNRVRDWYGKVKANWIDLDSLIRAKRAIDGPRHQEDVRVLRQVRKLRKHPR
jgi:hypothetical protein